MSNIKLYDTLAHKLRSFSPNNQPIKYYSCGPTVYDYQTIGNLRTFVFYDSLARMLKASGYELNHVMNITDVGHLVSDADEGEDKLEKGAAREGKTVWQVADHYTAAFMHDLKALNILEPKIVKATDYIEQQIALIKVLYENEYVYQTKAAIYFDTRKLADYGKLTGQNLADKVTGARDEVVTDQQKKHPQDFAVWFFAVGKYAKHSMRWPSPWGEGFPGWHLECSAIIHATLGEPIDIHSGGVDLIGTHHTNEIAQTEAAYGVNLANFWLHSEHLMVDGQRMGKSLGNFYTLEDVIKRGYDPLALRLLYLQAHYRTQMNFTWKALDAAQRRLKDLEAWADLRHQPSAKTMPKKLDELFRDTKKSMLESVQNDLNTAKALSALNKLVAYMQTIPIPGVEGRYTEGTLKFIDDLLGLKLNHRPDISQEQKDLIKQREIARSQNDWPKADELRHQLKDDGLEIKDTDHGPIWSRRLK